MRTSLTRALACCTLGLMPCLSLAQEAVKTPLEKAAETATAAQISGDSAWMMISTALVMLMTPGLALFYGGMVRRKNILATMMHSMVALAIVGVYWITIGYALAFGAPWLTIGEKGILGFRSELVLMRGVNPSDLLPGTNIPIYLHMLYQGMFAIITPALISGALAERIRFKPYCLFILVWMTLVYCPLAHMVWALNWWDAVDAGTKAVGYLGAMPALDFAGGTVVHISAGFSALAAILVLRKRLGYGEQAMHPNSMVLTLAGAGLLWFGWFGFNGGSSIGSNALAVSAFTATQAAAAAAGLSWLLVEWLHRGKPTALGLASGIVAGLVCVTPAAGFVLPWHGLVIGAIAGVVCYGSVCLKPILGYDDSLDAFGVHGVGGFLGAVITGVFCLKSVNSLGEDGFLAGAGFKQLGIQLFAAVLAAVLSLVASLVLVKLIDLLVGFTSDPAEEIEGLDRSEHGEIGFDYGLATGAVVANAEPKAAVVPPSQRQRYHIVVDGVTNGDLIKVWSEMCQPGAACPAEFKAVYPYVTTVQGSRFQLRGGDKETMRAQLEKLFQGRLRGVKVRVEP